MISHWRKVEFRASRDWNSLDVISLRAAETSSEHSPAVFMPVTMQTQADGEIIRPFLQLKENEAQALMDALWSVGCRPTKGHGSTGQLAAVERHLEDMRTLVFKGKAI